VLPFRLCLSGSDLFCAAAKVSTFFSVNCAAAFCVGNVSKARTSPVATDMRMTIPSFMAQAVDAASNRVIELSVLPQHFPWLESSTRRARAVG
jgi:hypothetical protein